MNEVVISSLVNVGSALVGALVGSIGGGFTTYYSSLFLISATSTPAVLLSKRTGGWACFPLSGAVESDGAMLDVAIASDGAVSATLVGGDGEVVGLGFATIE